MTDDFATRELLLKAALERNRAERSAIIREMDALNVEMIAAKEAAERETN